MTKLTRSIVFAVLAAGIGLTAAASPGLAKKSPAYCDSYARKQANQKVNGVGILAGTAIGAGTGALFGAAVGGHHSVGAGAVIGGIGGTAVGAVANENKWKKVYNKKYAECRSWP